MLVVGERAEGILLAAGHGGLRGSRSRRSYPGRVIMARRNPNDPLERFTFGLQTESIPEELIADATGGWSRRSTSWVPTRRIFASGSRRPSITVRARNGR